MAKGGSTPVASMPSSGPRKNLVRKHSSTVFIKVACVDFILVGFQRNLLSDFQKTRDVRVQRAAVETNRLLIRLEKVSLPP